MARNALLGLGMTVPDDEWRMTRAVNALGFGPMTQATQAGRQNALLSAGMPAARPNDYLAPVAETISPTMGGYGAGQMIGEGSRAIGQGDYLGGGAGLALGMAGMIPGAPKKGIRAFHGSPHDFDKFSLDKIGTGEGAQAYGHGLYFAENEGVANQYRHKLADRPTISVGGSTQFKVDTPESIVAARLSDYTKRRRVFGEDPTPQEVTAAVSDELGRYISTAAKNNDFDLYKALVDQRLALERMSEAGVEMNRPGRMYEVRINADPEDFLDWDKPLSEQSEKVREMFHGLSPETQGMELYRAAQGLDARERPKLTGDTMRDFIAQGWHDSGASTATKRGASEEVLKNAGIPGIRYLDQGSRTAGDGSRNYVVFRDDIIEIVKKYGLAAAVSTYGFDAVRGAMEDQQQ